jgi:hypothetical protein
MLNVFQELLASLRKASEQEHQDIALATIYSMFLSFTLTLLFALAIVL